MNQFFYSSGRFGLCWVKVDTVGSLGTITFDVPYPNPDHPFLAGLVEPINIILTEDLSVGRPLVSNALDSGTTLVGTTTTFNRTKMPLFTIDAGTILADPSSSAAGNIRIGWPLAGNFNNPDGWSVINANGEQIMRNIIATVSPVEPEPLRITNISLDPETGDFLVMFSPAGSDHVLKSSGDLVEPFKEVSSAVLEDGDSIFRVPADDLDSMRGFFIVELVP